MVLAERKSELSWPGPVGRSRVLVVDDEPLVRAALGACLREHEVTTAASAMDAMDLLRTGARFDAILCDMMMPQMSGMDFFLRLAIENPGAADRVVFITGGGLGEKARGFLARTSQPWLLKPWDPVELRAVVASACAGWRDR